MELTYMKNITQKTFLGLLSLAALSGHTATKAEFSSNQMLALKIGGGCLFAGATALATYFGYKHIEKGWLQTDMQTFQANLNTFNQIKNNQVYAYVIPDLTLWGMYSKDLGAYNEFVQSINADLARLRRIANETDTAIQYWKNTSMAESFVTQAQQEIENQMKQVQYTVSTLYNHYKERTALIELARMFDSEKNTEIRDVVEKGNQNTLTEAYVQMKYPQSAWPLVTAWNAIEARRQAYEKLVHSVKAFKQPSDCSNAHIDTAEKTITSLKYAQDTLALFLPSYTNQVLAKISHEQAEQKRKSEEAMRLRELELQRQKAEAAQREAAAKEEQVKLQKEQELQECMKQLNVLKESNANRTPSFGDQREILRLQSRISELRSELNLPCIVQ
jgi:hypothetical protein